MKTSKLIGLTLAAGLTPAFAAEVAELDVAAASQESEAILQTITVVGTPEKADAVPGSTTVLEGEVLKASRVTTVNEALRKAPGVNVRDEEGFGLRPNIGIRGLNPTRSTKVLLLEDGLPLAYAPYGDNASYYHPPIERFERIEVLKGANMNQYGPQTIGAVINYITPIPTEETQGQISLAGGSRDYFNARGRLGGKGLLFDFVRKDGDGARDNIDSKLEDYNLKGVLQLSPHQTLVLRANRYTEDSNITYSGLTDAELRNFGHEYNPFDNDTFEAERHGASASHELRFGSDDSVVTNLYWSGFSRDWWRQASTTTDGQCGAQFTADRAAGLQVDPDACNSTQGRLRDYHSYGVEPRLRLTHAVGGVPSELTVGARAHRETQSRLQKNGTSATARDGTLAENNRRETEAVAVFAQNRVVFGRLAITPGLRFESVDYLRRNRLNGDEGDDQIDQLIPSLGLSYDLSERYTGYASIHQGFAPPRTEDIISGTGVSVDVDAEESVNMEVGLRGRPHPAVLFEATAFRNDFDNLIAVGSIAGGSTPLSQGEALFQGLELSGRADGGRLMQSGHNPFFEVSYTAVPTARSESAFECLLVSGGCAAVGQDLPGSAPGRRLPYAPKNMLTTTLGYQHPVGVEGRVEAVFVDEQYSDFANTPGAPVNGNGQIGRIDDYTIWNASLNWRMPGSRLSLFAAAKNLTDKRYIVDRTRGIQTGMPRVVQGGVEYEF